MCLRSKHVFDHRSPVGATPLILAVRASNAALARRYLTLGPIRRCATSSDTRKVGWPRSARWKDGPPGRGAQSLIRLREKLRAPATTESSGSDREQTPTERLAFSLEPSTVQCSLRG